MTRTICPAIVALLVLSGCDGWDGYQPSDGDILFQTSRSGQSLAIQKATDSSYSHMAPISTFDLSDPVVQQKVRERWGGSPPEDEPVISPAAMFDSEQVVTVYEN